MCDDTVWLHQIETFGKSREVVVAEHGSSDSLATMAERILANASGKFALVGHSMGGRVALEIMARAPERVLRLALLDTGYKGLAPGETGEKEKAGRYRLLEIARTDGVLAMAQEWAKGMVYPPRLGDRKLMGAIHSMIVRAGLPKFEAQIKALLNREDRTELLKTLRLPTLVLCGHDDSWSTLSQHEAIAQLIPDSHLVDIPECGHMSTMEKPEAVTSALAEWLEI